MTTALTPTTSNDEPARGAGFDAPVTSRDQDHLNRWPLARQIYSVAVDGPEDWSARVGLYGEWGTGKTSVLRFVASMAEQDGHIVVWFDPWAYANKADLWRAFVLNLCNTAEAKLGGLTKAGEIRRKSYFDKGRELLGMAAKVVPGDYGSAASGGLDLLRGAFAFSSKDVLALKKDLKGHRVIVLIDDLDRTAAELVPEILYSLKEVMDVPGFSFICGFDPKVVGEVLASKHPGFGDGLMFLEKIIDYPVWLPAPPAEGLKRMAEADAAKYCPFIPSAALQDALELLPRNPRAIRQFVRITSLLKTQTDRHGDDELNWPIILTANAIKVRIPRLESSLTHSPEFYRSLGWERSMGSNSQDSEKHDASIRNHAAECLKRSQVTDASNEVQDWLFQALRRICNHLDIWMGMGAEGASYQANLAERPLPVTRKEFDRLFAAWNGKSSIPVAEEWISVHAGEHGFREGEIAEALVKRLVPHLKSELNAADGGFTAKHRGIHAANAARLVSLLENLLLYPEKFHPALASMEWIPLAGTLAEMIPLSDSNQPTHRKLWPSIRKTMVALVENWEAPLSLLVGAVRSISPNFRFSMEGKNSRRVAQQLNQAVDDHLCAQIIAGMKGADFVSRIAYDRENTREMSMLILHQDRRLWQGHRKRFLAEFKKAAPSVAVRGNAYAFLDWLNYLVESQEPGDKAFGTKLAADEEFMSALWRTATRKPFLGRHAYRLHEFPAKVADLGVVLEPPDWWDPATAEFRAELERESKASKNTGA